MIDDTDRRILSVLLQDARTSLRSIAEEVGVALGTVSNRVKRMEEMGVIQGGMGFFSMPKKSDGP